MDVAKRIKQYILDNGIKQTFIAEKTGIELNVLNACLNGKTRLTVDRLEKIAAALGVRPEFFLNSDSQKLVTEAKG